MPPRGSRFPSAANAWYNRFIVYLIRLLSILVLIDTRKRTMLDVRKLNVTQAGNRGCLLKSVVIVVRHGEWLALYAICFTGDIFQLPAEVEITGRCVRRRCERFFFFFF